MKLAIQNAWPKTFSVWFKSQVHEIIGPILMWRVDPSAETYQKLLPPYKPTALQLSVPHSAVIDWVPYSDLRDRVIMFFNGSAALDRLMCDFLNSYVIEVDDISAIFQEAPAEKGYFGIWNIFSGIGSTSADFANQSKGVADHGFGAGPWGFHLRTPRSVSATGVFEAATDFCGSTGSANDATNASPSAPHDHAKFKAKLVEILTTPALALKLSYDIGLYAAKRWKVDRTLFEQYPELQFEGYEDIVAQGTSYRVCLSPPEMPKELTSSAMESYQKSMQQLS